MCALPSKDLCDDRDEPLASEDEVEHENDSTDVELWRRKLVAWEEAEVVRKAEEERRRVEFERRRREWEEEQKRLYQQRLEETRRAMEEQEEELGEEEEVWDEQYDEQGNPVEESYEEDMMDESGMIYDAYGQPVEFLSNGAVPGMFADVGSYKTSVDLLEGGMESAKSQAMSAEWDDWEDDGEMEVEQQRKVEDVIPTSMVAHMVQGLVSHSSSLLSHVVRESNCDLTVPTKVIDLCTEEEEDPSQSFASHAVSLQPSSSEIHSAPLVHSLACSKPTNVQIPQVDGLDEDSSDDDMDDDQQGIEVSDESSIMSVDVDEEVSQERQAQEADSDSEPEERRRSEADSDSDEKSSADHQDGQDERMESADADSYASDFDDEVNERAQDSEDSSSDTEPYEAAGDDVEVESVNNEEVERLSDSDIENIEPDQEDNEARKDEDENLEDGRDEDSRSRSRSRSVSRSRSASMSRSRSRSRSERAATEAESESEDEDISNDVPVKQPCILVFDSLGGRTDRQARLCGVLRDFLTLEYQAKYPGQTKEFSAKTIPGCAPKVPQQPNMTDCGIYVCHNVETFFQKPIQDYTMPITSLENWFPDSEPRVKRRDIAQLIKNLATEQNKDKLEQLILPDLVFVEAEKPKLAWSYSQTQRDRSDGESDEEEYYSDENDFEDDNEEDRRNKRSRSFSSGSEERDSRRRKMNHSSDEEDFDPRTVYGSGQPLPLRKLPPGISISRSTEEQSASSPSERLRNLPGISISGGPSGVPLARSLPAGISVSRAPAPTERESSQSSQSSQPLPVSRGRIVSEYDKLDVSVENVSDHSDEMEPFDLDKPAHLRTYLSPSSFKRLDEERLASAEEERHSMVAEDLNTSFSSMIAHQAAEAVLDSCLSSMLCHRVSGPSLEQEEDQEDELLPQCDGLEDFDSEEDVEAGAVVDEAEDVQAAPFDVPVAEVEEEQVSSSTDIVEEAAGSHPVTVEHSGSHIEESSLPETTEQHDVLADIVNSEVDLAEDDLETGEVFEEPQETFQEVSNTEESVYPVELSVEDEENVTSGLLITGDDDVEETVVEAEESYEVHEDLDMDQDQASFGEDLKDEEEFESDYDDEEFNSPEPPAKRSRPSSEPEVVLDSDDNEDVTPQPPSLPGQPRPQMFPYNPHQQQFMSQQQHAMLVAQQRAQQAAYYNNLQLQLQQQQQQQQQQSLGRKRKREGVALCIRDGQVYTKPFTQLPAFLVNNNTKPDPPQLPQVPQVQQNFMFLQQQQTNPYKPLSQNPYQPSPAMFHHQPQSINTRTDRDSVEDLEDSDEDILDDASREDEEDFNSDDDIQSLNEENQHKDDSSKDSFDSKENITEEVSEELTGEAAEEVIQEDTEEVIEDPTEEVIEDVIEEPHIDPQEDIVLGDDNSM